MHDPRIDQLARQPSGRFSFALCIRRSLSVPGTGFSHVLFIPSCSFDQYGAPYVDDHVARQPDGRFAVACCISASCWPVFGGVGGRMASAAATFSPVPAASTLLALALLAKLTLQLGVNPDTDNCIFCSVDLDTQNMYIFDPQNGGFVCAECVSKQGETISGNVSLQHEYQNSMTLRKNLKLALHIPYKDYSRIQNITQGLSAAEFSYINYQFGFSAEKFNTWKLINI